ncbi:DUF397 domain-containing protein [Kitasatospora sp. NPDC096147]|uniref:DUF397 domain-containing protein n=1 Tax=Kitasatospora sp. NPDC096147 TaxID=3364093 RepID=UPI00382C5A5A
MPAGTIDNEGEGSWFKASASASQGACAEVKDLRGQKIALRQSTDPTGPALIFTAAEFTAFVAGAKAGEFDLLGRIA